MLKWTAALLLVVISVPALAQTHIMYGEVEVSTTNTPALQDQPYGSVSWPQQHGAVVLNNQHFGTFGAGQTITFGNGNVYVYAYGGIIFNTGQMTVQISDGSTTVYDSGPLDVYFRETCPNGRFSNGAFCHYYYSYLWGYTNPVTITPWNLGPPGLYTVTVTWSGTAAGTPNPGGCTSNCYQVLDVVSTATLEVGTVPLPVELTSFEAARDQEHGVRLHWTTASENSNDGFYIERSTDSQTWDDLGFVRAAQSTGGANYTHLDTRAVSGSYYYRLRQVDHDGTFAHSDIVYVEMRSGAPGLSAAPNPASNVLTVTNETVQSAPVSMYSSLGRRVWQLTLSPGEGRELDVSDLPTGRYSIVGAAQSFSVLIQ